MLPNNYLIVIFILILSNVITLLVAFLSQQRYLTSRRNANNVDYDKEKILKEVEEKYLKEIEALKVVHAVEIRNIRKLYKEKVAETTSGKSNKEKEIIERAEKKSAEIIATAENTAETITKEAQERVKLYISKREEELNKSIAKIVIQVVKRVIGKTLTYDEHKELILKSLEGIE